MNRHEPTISLCRISKHYRIGRETPYIPLRRLRGDVSPADQSSNIIWALHDISFEVYQGECIGIIGHNGAGKTTLLKILSRITRPSAGRAEINGHIAGLLEAGAGFHPELTGRENVHLNGAMLGMQRSDLQAKFDAIADFAGIKEFLDTPLKRYSAGMRVRLAFAVITHLDAGILLIDEVLTVGDRLFQKACMEIMQRATNAGRTILFVSHNLEAVRKVCTRAVWLHKGQLASIGPTAEVLDAYKQQK